MRVAQAVWPSGGLVRCGCGIVAGRERRQTPPGRRVAPKCGQVTAAGGPAEGPPFRTPGLDRLEGGISCTGIDFRATACYGSAASKGFIRALKRLHVTYLRASLPAVALFLIPGRVKVSRAALGGHRRFGSHRGTSVRGQQVGESGAAGHR